ncbi:hypothetical protein BH24DEI2_BH24DEI2_26640 [soil metagenome]
MDPTDLTALLAKHAANPDAFTTLLDDEGNLIDTARDADHLLVYATVADVLAATAGLGEPSSILGTTHEVLPDMIQKLQGLADGVAAEKRRLLIDVPTCQK